MAKRTGGLPFWEHTWRAEIKSADLLLMQGHAVPHPDLQWHRCLGPAMHLSATDTAVQAIVLTYRSSPERHLRPNQHVQKWQRLCSNILLDSQAP